MQHFGLPRARLVAVAGDQLLAFAAARDRLGQLAGAHERERQPPARREALHQRRVGGDRGELLAEPVDVARRQVDVGRVLRRLVVDAAQPALLRRGVGRQRQQFDVLLAAARRRLAGSQRDEAQGQR
jgi:hypothetical protein